MLLVSFAAELCAPISEGSVLTIGWPIGAAIIIGSWLLTGWFVSRANGEFDQPEQRDRPEASK
jgi:uncharacterized membrane protein (DUF485 family)